MSLNYRERYWADLQARSSFKSFMITIHGLDFTKWEAAGYWDDDYIPFSYFSGDKVIASVCIYTMPAIVNGERCKVAQVSGVGTLPEFRRQGLNQKLHEIALDWAFKEHKFVFLFSDEDAYPFYAKCGFTPIKDYAPTVQFSGLKREKGLEKLDMEDESQVRFVYELALRRSPISNIFSNLNPKLVMFHALYSLRDHVYRVPGLNTVVFLKREGERTIIYDILANEIPQFNRLYPFLTSEASEEFEFRFMVDKLGLQHTGLKELNGNDTHVMGKFNLGPHFVFPFTAQA